jgi:hypothetical protein
MPSMSDPNGIRTRIAEVKVRCPEPLDDGAVSPVCYSDKPATRASCFYATSLISSASSCRCSAMDSKR